MYELLAFILLSVTLECGAGIIYGVGMGYNPLVVLPAAILLNFAAAFIAVLVIGKFLNWRPGIKNWVERRLARGQKVVDKYGYLGIMMGVVVLSPVQLAIVGKLLGMERSKLYPSVLGATTIVGAAFLGVALGIFKILL